MYESEKWKWSRSVMSDSSDPMDCSPPGSSIHGIFQARVLEWGAIAFSSVLVRRIQMKLKEIEEASIWNINRSTSEFLIYTKAFFPGTYPTRNSPMVSGIRARLRKARPHTHWFSLSPPRSVPALVPPCPRLALVVPFHGQEPGDARCPAGHPSLENIPSPE